MMRPIAFFSLLTFLLLLLATPVAAQETTTEIDAPATTASGTDGPVVQAVFYFSPTCGHCEHVIANVLPGLFRDHGGDYELTYDASVLPAERAYYLMSNGRLQLLMVDASTEPGARMFRQDSERLGIERAGVPRLDYDEREFLVGSADIPDRFPAVVAAGLAGEGLAWPPVDGIDEALAPFVDDGSVRDPATAEEETDEELAVLPLGGDGQGWGDRFGQDVVGNSVSVVVLALLLLSVLAVPILAIRGSLPTVPSWIVMALAVVGLGVAAYLATIETTGDAAVCGPVGDCNAVQQSEYAMLGGVVPIGVLGVVAYAAIGGLWVLSHMAQGTTADTATVLIGIGAWMGTLFSVYLTFLEPFVIGATCMWCITSALVMMALLWVSASPALAAWHRLRDETPQTAAHP